MGKKYIIELLDDCQSEFKGIMVFGLTQEKQISVELIPEESLRPYTEPDLEQVKADAYNDGYKAGRETEKVRQKIRQPDLEQIRKEAYEQGLSDAKEGKATCQYCEYQYLDDTEEPCKKCCKAYMNKYKPKAKEEQIQVGDEVITASGKAVVIGVGPVYFEYFYADGSTGFDKVKSVSKTGGHFPEIAAVLEKMRESE